MTAIAQDKLESSVEKNNSVIFQQYEQKTVKPLNYSYNDSFMNYMIFPYAFMRKRHGFTYYGPDFWNGTINYNEYSLQDLPENTLVDPQEYMIQPRQ